MRILDGYLRKTILSNVLTVMLILLGLFSFFEFVDELDTIGKGSYSLFDAILYVMLRIPSLAYELFPLGALIGSLVGLGTLVSQNEIIVMRSAGISVSKIVFSTMKTAAILMFITVLIGELIVPVTEQYASYRRSVEISDQITLKTRNGLWVREGQSYLNVRKILPGDIINDIFIYTFDEENRLTTSSYAQSANYKKGQWQLQDITTTHISGQEIKRDTEATSLWNSLLRPELISLVSIEPANLSMFDLFNYSHYLKKNNQDNRRYRQALWSKLIYPLTTGAMIFLAIPIVLSAFQSQNLGQRVFIGIVIGLVFHIVNQGMANLGIVYKLPPFLAVAAPAMLILIVGAYLMRRLVK